MVMTFLRLGAGPAFALFLAGPVVAQPIDWLSFRDAQGGFEIDLPMGLFDAEAGEQTEGTLTLYEVDGEGQLVVYAGTNEEARSPAEYAAFLEQTDRVADVTYQASGRSWFVMSGYYDRDDVEEGTLIFYAKMMFNADRTAFSSFEISYPLAEKERYDPIVTRLEKSLRAPE